MVPKSPLSKSSIQIEVNEQIIFILLKQVRQLKCQLSVAVAKWRTNRAIFAYFRQSERLKAKPTTSATKQFLILFNIFSRKIFVIFFQIYIVTNWIVGTLGAQY